MQNNYKNKKECYTNEFKQFQIDDNKTKELQSALLGIMKDISQICEDNKLNYTLAGGSMLGAVRHKGFIPWDDDMDLIMSNPDIKKLNEILKKEYNNKYYLASAKYGNSQCLFYKVMLKGTKIVDIEAKNFPFENCLNIDIFPIENIPTNKFVRKVRTKQLQFYKGLLTSYYNIKYPSELLIERAKETQFLKKRFAKMKILGFIAKLLGIKNIIKKCYKILEYKKQTKLVGIPSSFDYEREIFKSDFFDKTELVDFEDLKLRIVSDYHTYLTNLYGDYMKIPPVEKRENHIYMSIDLGNSFKNK